MAFPARILTVCTGNVCRSPYLERRLQSELDRVWGPGAVQVGSAGIAALVGSAMDPDSQRLLEAAGGTADGFVAHQIDAQLLAEQQLVIVAAREHRSAVSRLWPRGLSRTHTLLDLAQLCSQVTAEELPARGGTAREWLELVVPLIASKRGLQLPLDAAAAEVVDPFRQPEEVFARMQAQIEEALPPVLRVLGA